VYNPDSAGAKLGVEDGVHVVIWARYADGWHGPEPYPASRKDGHFVCELPIREPLFHLSISVVNRYGIAANPDAPLETMIYRPDGQPVRHAYASQISEADFDAARDLFDKELSLYPDNYYAYYWWSGAVEQHDPAEYPTRLATMLRQLEQAVKGEPLDYQFVRVAAYLDMENEAAARRILLKMLKDAPQARFTYFASRLYQHRAYARSFAGPGPTEVHEAIISAAEAHPGAPLARLGLEEYVFDDAFPAKALHAIADAWVVDDPLHSLPYFARAVAADREGRKQTAYEAVRRAIELTLTANMNLPASFDAAQQEYLLPAMYRLFGKTSLGLSKPLEALGAVNAGMKLAGGESSGALEELEGEIWASLCFTGLAERAFMAAHLRSAARGREGLRKLHERSHGSEVGFEAHFSEVLESGLKDSLEPAPDFEMKTMDGTLFTAQTLRGKVVVLNFWFIGCAPCQREIPELNRTVDAFAGRNDLVFLAPASDRPEALAAYLHNRPFKYQVVPNAAALNERFEINGHPTHMVIDGKGRIVWRSAGDTTFSELKPMIDRALSLGNHP
jgi:peroxiredoxin